MSTLELQGNLDSLGSLQKYVQRGLEPLEAPADLVHDIRLVCEEIFTNIVYYAVPNNSDRVQVECSVSAENLFCIQFRDRGIPFNPLDYDPPGLDLDVDSREPGGLGIHLVRQLAHKIHYVRQDGANILTVCFRF